MKVLAANYNSTDHPIFEVENIEVEQNVDLFNSFQVFNPQRIHNGDRFELVKQKPRFDILLVKEVPDMTCMAFVGMAATFLIPTIAIEVEKGSRLNSFLSSRRGDNLRVIIYTIDEWEDVKRMLRLS